MVGMSLNIKNDETCRLAGELARLTGETMTGAIAVALRERLKREKRERGVETRVKLAGYRGALLQTAGSGTLGVGAWRYALRRAGIAQVIVDSSAVLAVLYREPDVEHYETAIATALNCRMSVANVLEMSIALEGRGGVAAGHELDTFLDQAGIELAPVTAEQLQAARLAWRRFGKGNHRAALNFGDCFAYALAKTTGEPPPFKGKDCASTDIEAR